MASEKKIIFVYNANSGLFNLLSDIAAKALPLDAPLCTLCELTHDPLSMKKEWKTFIETLPDKTTFLHRDEFKKKHPDLESTKLPAVFIYEDNSLRLIVTAKEIDGVENLESLKTLITEKL